MAGLGAARRGIVRTDLANKAGVSPNSFAALRRRGTLVSLGRGVDRLRDHPFDHWSQCQAALDLAGPGAVLGLRTAARLHGFYRNQHSDAIEVVVRRKRDHRTSVGRVIETRWLPPQHVTEVDRFPVTTPARTFFDLCGDPDPGFRRRGGHPAHDRRMRDVYNDAVARRGLTFVQEAAVLTVMARRGRRGTRLVRELLLRFGKDYVPTRSQTESLFMEVVWTYGLPEPEKQGVMSDVEGFIGTVDFVWRPQRVVVETDSSWHDGPVDVEVDAERDDRLTAAGYTVKRYRYGDIVRSPSRVAHELAAAIGL
ncbi:MAG: DUF559 domain-containing protein [Acidimicrobiales bacterium]